MMNDRLKRIQSMAQRYNSLGVVSDEAVASIDAAIESVSKWESEESKPYQAAIGNHKGRYVGRRKS